MIEIGKEKLVGIKEVVFGGEAGPIIMKVDPRFSPDIESTNELGVICRGTFCNVPCRVEEHKDDMYKYKLEPLTNEDVEKLGINPVEMEVYYKADDILYIKGNDEVEKDLAEIGDIISKITDKRFC